MVKELVLNSIVLYSMLSEVFWTIFLTTTSGFLLKLASMAYKSKCTEAEIELDEIVINKQPSIPESPTKDSEIETKKPLISEI